MTNELSRITVPLSPLRALELLSACGREEFVETHRMRLVFLWRSKDLRYILTVAEGFSLPILELLKRKNPEYFQEQGKATTNPVFRFRYYMNLSLNAG